MGCSASVEEIPVQAPRRRAQLPSAGLDSDDARSAAYRSTGGPAHTNINSEGCTTLNEDLQDYSCRSIGRATAEPSTISVYMRVQKTVVGARVAHGITGEVDQFEAFPESSRDIQKSIERCTAWMKAQQARRTAVGHRPRSPKSLVAFHRAGDGLLENGHSRAADNTPKGAAFNSPPAVFQVPHCDTETSAAGDDSSEALLSPGGQRPQFKVSPPSTPHMGAAPPPRMTLPGAVPESDAGGSPLIVTAAAPGPAFDASVSACGHRRHSSHLISIDPSSFNTAGTSTAAYHTETDPSNDSMRSGCGLADRTLSPSATIHSIVVVKGYFHHDDMYMPLWESLDSAIPNPALHEGVALMQLPYHLELNEELLKAHNRLIASASGSTSRRRNKS